MTRHAIASNPVLRLAAGGSLLAAGAGTGALATALLTGAVATAGATVLPGITITVDSLADPGPGDTAHCIDPVLADCTLRDAIATANYLPGADTITFDPTLSGTIVLSGNLEMISESLTITGPGADVITIEGNHASYGFAQDLRSFGQQGNRIDLEVSGLHLDGMTGDFVDGSLVIQLNAISVFRGTLDVHDAVVTDSGSTNQGSNILLFTAPITAGTFGYGSSLLIESVTIDRVEVSDNHSASDGDTINHPGSIAAFANSVHIGDSRISGNTASSIAGPLVFADTVDVIDTTIDHNTSTTYFAGLALVCNTCTISGSTIDHNTSLSSAGVVLYSNRGGNPLGGVGGHSTITDTAISYNSNTGGGALTIRSDSGTVVADRLSIVGNTVTTAPVGIASNLIATALEISGDVRLHSSTIADNSSNGITINEVDVNNDSTPDSLGARRRRLMSLLPASMRAATPSANAGGRSTLRLSHSTVSGNSGNGLSGIPGQTLQPTADQVILDHSLLFGNGAGVPGGADLMTPSTARFSLIGNAAITPTVSELDAFVDGPTAGNLLGVDPELQPLEWTSPLVAVRPILFGSPAWNAGDPNFVPPPDTDQRGLPRVIDIVDIGAYEVQEALVLPAFTG